MQKSVHFNTVCIWKICILYIKKLKKLWHLYTMKYYYIKKEENLYDLIWKNFQAILLTEKSIYGMLSFE